MRKLVAKIVLPALLLAALAASACRSGGDPPVARTTPNTPVSPAAEVTPGGGPFVVWIADSDSAPGALTVSVYDLAARRIVSAFDLSGVVTGVVEPRQMVVAGGRIIANHGYQVVAYGLDGSHDADHPFRTVAYRLSGMAASPDGETLALTYANDEVDACDAGGCIPAAETGFVAFVDSATGDDIATVFRHNTPGFAGFDGDLSRPVWRDDGTGVVVIGTIPSDRPASIATVLIDGTVRIHGSNRYGSVAPNGRYFADGEYEAGCELLLARREIAIRDLDSGAILGSVRDDTRVLAAGSWSPDSDEIAYSAVDQRTGIQPNCGLPDEPTRRWFILRADGSPPEPIADPLAANRAWYGDRAIEYECRGERLIDAYCQGPQTQPEEMRVYVGGQLIGSGKNALVVGFVEP